MWFILFNALCILKENNNNTLLITFPSTLPTKFLQKTHQIYGSIDHLAMNHKKTYLGSIQMQLQKGKCSGDPKNYGLITVADIYIDWLKN